MRVHRNVFVAWLFFPAALFGVAVHAEGLDSLVCVAQEGIGPATPQETTRVVNVGTTLQEGALSGVISAVMREAYRRAGMVMDLQLLPSRRSIHLADEGVTDAELFRGRVVEKLYPNLRRVKVPIYWSHEVPFYRNAEFAVEDYQELKKYRVAYKRGVVSWENRIGDSPDAVPVNDDKQGMTLLDEGRIDVFVDNQLLGRRALSQLGLDGISFGEPLLAVSFYHYVHKTQMDLIPMLEAALNQMEAEGLIDRIAGTCEQDFIDREIANVD